MLWDEKVMIFRGVSFKGPAAESCSKINWDLDLRRTRAIQIVEKNRKTHRIRARLTIMNLPVPPVILRPTLQGLDKSKSSFAKPMSREVTFFHVPCVCPNLLCNFV